MSYAHAFIPFRAAAAVLALALGACAHEYRCPLNSRDGYCSSVQETHAAALRHNDARENYLEYKAVNPEAERSSGSASSAAGVKGMPIDGPPAIAPPIVPLSEAHLEGPLFIPAKPYRYWVAPWTDANGIVHGGEMQYFVIPGRFTYGPLDAPGGASGVMGPIDPQALGFKPVEQKPQDSLINPRETFLPVSEPR
jgi:hypothetical protein